MSVFRVEGQKGTYTIVEFGYPPISEPRKFAESDGWEEQPGLFGERVWVGIRSVESGLVSYVSPKHKKFTPVESREA